MAQFGRPSSDVSSGPWLPSTSTTLFGVIDEASPDDADFAYTTSSGLFQVGLSSVTDPATSTGHVVRFRMSGDTSTNGVITLYDTTNSSAISTFTVTSVPAAASTYSFTLTGAAADSISSYADLRLWFNASTQVTQITRSTLASALITPQTSTTVSTASISPAGNTLLLAILTARPVGDVSTTSYISVDGNGLTWVRVAEVVWTNEDRILSIHRSMGASPSSGAVTFTLANTTFTDDSLVTVLQFSGVDTSGTHGSGAVGTVSTRATGNVSTIGITVPGTPDGNDVTYATISVKDQGQSPVITVDALWEEINQIGPAVNTAKLSNSWDEGQDTTPDWTWTGGTNDVALITFIINSA